MSVAKRLYYQAQDMLEFAAEVTDIRLESRTGGTNRWQVALDRTAFYPESGGQPCDMGTLEAVSPSGTRLQVPVLAVVEENAEVWHVVEKPLAAGTPVKAQIDGARRRDHMQQHTGQHLLSAMFLREIGASTVSFHLGRESSTIDLAVDALTQSQTAAVEALVNAVIADDRRVSVADVERPEAEAMLACGALHKLPEREGAIRVVEIAGVEWNACGGTHVASTGRIGGLTVRGVEKVKQGVRVEFCCGLRAVRTARRDFETLAEIGRLLSTGAGNLVPKVQGMLDEARAAAKARKAMLDELAGMEAQAIVGTERLVEASARDAEYGKLLASKIAALDRIGLVHSLAEGRATVVLAAESQTGIDCGEVMKAALAAVGARGGGSAAMAQGGVAEEHLNRLLQELRSRT